MRNKKKIPTIIALISFVLLSLGYEYAVSLWSMKESGAIIRVDIILIYPIIIGISIGIYFLSKKIINNT